MNRLTGIFKMPVNHDGMARRGESIHLLGEKQSHHLVGKCHA